MLGLSTGFFLKNVFVWANGSILGPKMAHPCISGSNNKIFVWGKWTILDPKMVHPHNLGYNLVGGGENKNVVGE